MIETTPLMMLAGIVSQYAASTQPQKQFNSRFSCQAREGQLNTGHNYAFVLCAPLGSPSAAWVSHWRSFDIESNDAEKFAQKFKCAQGQASVLFERYVVVVDMGAWELPIEVFAAGGVPKNVANSLIDCAVSSLRQLFSDGGGEIFGLGALLLPPSSVEARWMRSAGDDTPANWHERSSGGRSH